MSPNLLKKSISLFILPSVSELLFLFLHPKSCSFMKRLVIFASGSGTNAENIVNYFRKNNQAETVLILSNKQDAKVLDRATKLESPSVYFTRTDLYNNDKVLQLLLDAKPDLIILAGFLWRFPEEILRNYPNKVINIHPALLPKYGGKGMYGMHVHESVVENNETETGITIHYVNEHYDEGAIIFQASTPINTSDTPLTVANKVHQLEYEFFPKIISQLINE